MRHPRTYPPRVVSVPLPPSGVQGTTAESWPLHSFLELGALPGAVPCARLHSRQLLWEWGLSQFSEQAELLVSELMTNAVQASRSMEEICPVRLWLMSDRTRVLILIWDTNPQQPIPSEADEDTESGRGLVLVEAISEQWNWYFAPETGGKVVWCLVMPPKGSAT
jgi:anti-sigma regulatory factor (Ser/Thr protein kinase)